MSLHYLATPYQHYKQRVRGGAGAFDLIDLIKGGASAAVDCFQRFHKHLPVSSAQPLTAYHSLSHPSESFKTVPDTSHAFLYSPSRSFLRHKPYYLPLALCLVYHHPSYLIYPYPSTYIGTHRALLSFTVRVSRRR
jgi:hypothetical protein